MSTTLTYTSLNAQVPWPSLLAQQLEHWHRLTTVTAPEVVLHHQRGDSQAFRVIVRLDVPGSSLRTEARDSTLEGALLTATRDLERQIQARKTKPLGRGKSTRPASAISRPKTSRKARRRTHPPGQHPAHGGSSCPAKKVVQFRVTKKEQNEL